MSSPPPLFFNFIRIQALVGRATELSLQILQFTVSHKIKTLGRLSETTISHHYQKDERVSLKPLLSHILPKRVTAA